MNTIFRPRVVAAIVCWMILMISRPVHAQLCPINVNILNGDTAWVCPGDTILLNASPGLANYAWNNGLTSSTIPVWQAGVYSVNSTNNGCTSVDYVVVVFYPAAPQILLTPSAQFQEICQGDSLLLTVQNPIFSGYLWNIDNNTSSSILLDSTGYFWVVGYDGNGCRDTSDYISLVVKPLPVFSLGNDTASCEGDSVLLDAGSGFAAYNWTGGPATQTRYVTTSGYYEVAVTGQNGCTSKDQVFVLFNGIPLISLGPDSLVCNGNVVLLDAGNGYAAYEWQDGSDGRTFLATQSGTYMARVQDSLGCYSPWDEVNIVVDTPAAPVITLNGGMLYAGGGVSWQWYMNGNALSGDTNAIYRPVASGNYSVSITDANGCPAESASPFNFELIVKAIQGFSPNGDGIGDKFLITNIELFPQSELKIFNRWGTLVYEATGYANTWNGMSLNGQELPDGTYFFTLDLNDGKSAVISDYIVINR